MAMDDFNMWYKLIAIEGKRPMLPINLPREIQNIIELAWSTNPQDRPTAQEIYDTLCRCF